MINNDKTQAMVTYALLSTLLIMSRIRTAGDGFNWDFPRPPASIIITKNIHGHALYIEPVFYGGFVQPPQRRLLEYPRRTKQVYRSHDYNIARGRRQSRNKLDEGRPYRSSAVKDDEDEEEEEEEEEDQGDEEDKIDDEDADEEAAEQDEEETVAVAAARTGHRVARSGYVPLGDEANERKEREVVRIRSATEECDEPTEPAQYYEYETEVRNVASQDVRGERRMVLSTIIGVKLLIFLLA